MARAITQVLDEYGQRYLAGDTDGVVELCEVPFLAVRNGEPFHLLDQDAVHRHFQEHIDGYRQAGGTAIERVFTDVTRLGERSSFATVRWHIFDDNNNLVRARVTTYLLVKPGSGWRIAAYVNHDA